MKKLQVNIINNTMNNKIHISIDNGEYQVIPSNSILHTLLRIIQNPDKYEVEIAEY